VSDIPCGCDPQSFDDPALDPQNADPATDINNLWTLYQNTQNQLIQVSTEKLAILNALIAIRTGNVPDFTSISEAGKAGSDTYSQKSLSERLTILVEAEKTLTDVMAQQRLLAIQAEPGFSVARISTTCGYRW